VNTRPVAWGVVVMVGLGAVLWPAKAMTQEIISDQVIITSGQGRLFGITSSEGISRKFLAAGEEILAIEAKGSDGFLLICLRLNTF